MTLSELIDYLSSLPPETPVECGFHEHHSWRGHYEELAFEPKRNTTVGEMLDCAKDALGKTFDGYKGGAFEMKPWTRCHLSRYGVSTGPEYNPLSKMLLQFLCEGRADFPPEI